MICKEKQRQMASTSFWVSVNCHKTALMKLSMQHDGKLLQALSQVLTINILRVHTDKVQENYHYHTLNGFHLHYSNWLLLLGYFCFLCFCIITIHKGNTQQNTSLIFSIICQSINEDLCKHLMKTAILLMHVLVRR